MKTMQDFYVFLETAKQGSFSKAANVLDLTPAAVSATIKRLETQLDTMLFVRSTRNLRITAEGERFREKCQIAVDAIEEGIQLLNQKEDVLQGDIKLSMPSDIGRNLILPWIDEFMDQHPKISISVVLSDSLTNMYTEPVDAAIRYGIPGDSTMVALPICQENQRVLCASPHFLQTSRDIRHPTDLETLNCLSFMLFSANHSRWRFFQGQDWTEVKVSGNRKANDGDVVKRWVVAGKGIGYKSLLDVSEELLAGKLIRLLTDWQGEPAPLYLVCPDRRQLTPELRILREFLAEKCQNQRIRCEKLPR